MNFKTQLEKMDACNAAIEWVGDKSLEQAWAECERPDWMFWLCVETKVDHKLIVLTACAIAETVLKYVPEGELRPAEAIRVARLWCEGKVTVESAARAARAARAAAEAWSAAWSAAWAASAASRAASAAAGSAAWAASGAATCAAWAASGSASWAWVWTADPHAASAEKQYADVIRTYIPFELINKEMR